MLTQEQQEKVRAAADAVLILGQYRAAMNRFHTRHFKRGEYGGAGYWITKEYLEEKAAEEAYDDEDDEDDEDEVGEDGEGEEDEDE